MAGPFAHITLVDTLCLNARALETLGIDSDAIKKSLGKFAKFTELGAISPDCPYLKLVSGDAASWANVMHYWKTGDFIRSAIPYIYGRKWSSSDTQKCIAWLFGYAAHVVTDCTVHPVINRKVGPYEQNKTQHRLCEMNQDVYIFHKLNGQFVETAEYIRRCGISQCKDLEDDEKLDPAVRGLWRHCLTAITETPVRMDKKKAPEKDPTKSGDTKSGDRHAFSQTAYGPGKSESVPVFR